MAILVLGRLNFGVVGVRGFSSGAILAAGSSFGTVCLAGCGSGGIREYVT